MGWKDWVYGDLVSAADFQSLVQDQTVQRYADSAARTSALGSAVAEGMVSYLDDTNAVEVYNGSSWGSLGGSGATNIVLNSSFDIWQRGTSGTASGTSAGSGYNADRWFNYYAGAMTVSRQATGDTTNLPNIQYAARIQRNSGQTSATSIYHAQDIETINSVPFAGKTVAFSFYARKGANYSGASSNLTYVVQSGTGTDQHILGGYTGSASIVSGSATLTTTWQRFTATGTVASTATQIGIYFTYDGVGTAGAADYFEVTGVQLEVGSSATAFKRNAPSIQGELAACQRYYYRQNPTGSINYRAMGMGVNSTSARIFAQLPVTMRVLPTSVEFSNLALSDTATSQAVTAISINAVSSPGVAVLDCSAASGLTQYRPYFLFDNSSFSAYLGFNAEL